MENPSRRCARCGTHKNLSFFPHARANNCLNCAAVAASRMRSQIRQRCDQLRELRAKERALLPPKPPKPPRQSPTEKRCTNCDDTKPAASFSPHRELRDGLNSWCRVCCNAQSREWRKTPEGREKWREAKRRHRANMTPAQAQKERARLDAIKARQAEARRHAKALALAQRLDALLSDHRAHVDEWRQQPKERRRATKPWWDVDDADLASDPRPNRVKKLRRIRTINRATPPWADKAQIAEAYRAARLLTEQTGNLWHVDHIIPLRHPLVCGLHCAANLQLLPSVYNEAKGNQWGPDHA